MRGGIAESDTDAFARKYPKLAQAFEENHLYPLNVYQHFERILGRIEFVWDAFAGHEYLETLLMTQRHDRQGFEEPVASELIRIHLLDIKHYSGRYYNSHDLFFHIV